MVGSIWESFCDLEQEPAFTTALGKVPSYNNEWFNDPDITLFGDIRRGGEIYGLDFFFQETPSLCLIPSNSLCAQHNKHAFPDATNHLS